MPSLDAEEEELGGAGSALGGIQEVVMKEIGEAATEFTDRHFAGIYSDYLQPIAGETLFE